MAVGNRTNRTAAPPPGRRCGRALKRVEVAARSGRRACVQAQRLRGRGRLAVRTTGAAAPRPAGRSPRIGRRCQGGGVSETLPHRRPPGGPPQGAHRPTRGKGDRRRRPMWGGCSRGRGRRVAGGREGAPRPQLGATPSGGGRHGRWRPRAGRKAARRRPAEGGCGGCRSAPLGRSPGKDAAATAATATNTAAAAAAAAATAAVSAAEWCGRSGSARAGGAPPPAAVTLGARHATHAAISRAAEPPQRPQRPRIVYWPTRGARPEGRSRRLRRQAAPAALPRAAGRPPPRGRGGSSGGSVRPPSHHRRQGRRRRQACRFPPPRSPAPTSVHAGV